MATQPQNAYWQRPLPPGWEAKYDANARRYFFIHHETRNTTWEDPRPKYYAQLAAQGQQPSPRPQRSPRPSTPTPQSQMESIPLQNLSRPKCKTCQQKEVQRTGLDCYECQVKEQQRQVALRRAQEHEQEEVRRRESQQRIEILQKQRRIQSAQRRNDGNNRTLDTVNSEQETSFNNASRSPRRRRSPARSPAHSPPKQVQIRAAEKTRLKDKLKAEFSQHPEFLIQMALETAGYDEKKARNVLSAAGSSSSARQTGNADSLSTSDSNRQTSPSGVEIRVQSASSGTKAVAFEESAAMKAVVFGDDDDNDNDNNDSSSSSSSSEEEESISRPSTVSSSSSRPAVTSMTRTRPIQAHVARPVVVQYETIVGGYKSLLCCKPSGHDSCLVKGPSREHLISEYTVQLGPNPELQHGPDAQNVSGPIERSKKKKEKLACGPQANLCRGPQYSNIGSMYSTISS